MRRSTLLLWCGLTLTGCSTSPCADFLDHFFPMKPPASAAGAYGGVCNPVPAAPGAAGGPVAPPGLTTPPAGNVITGPPVVPAPAGTNPAPPPGTGAPFIPGQSAP
ncbi:MAG TPA: hypothetical protein PLX97_04655, partial [Gemmatales bacterium]|nr:hypothetical protein [Gemmatales bacterium]